MKKIRRRGFTLVEMLVVIAIIGILAGIVLRLHTLVGERTARARTLARIQNIKLCLEEYYRQNGEYPPQAENRPSDPQADKPAFVKHGTECEGFDWTERKKVDKFWWDKTKAYPSYVRSDYTGLVYYLVAPTNMVVSDWYRSEPARWKEYWDSDVGLNGWQLNFGGTSHGSQEYTNTVYRLLDGWDRQFVYMCSTNNDLQTFKLYSMGPDGKAFDDTSNSSTAAQREEWGRDDIGRVGMGE